MNVRRIVSRTILVVDDDQRIRESLSRILSRNRHRVESAASAEDALSRIAALAPDLVLSDVRMPGMGGVELLRLLRERLPDVDVVLMTAYEDLPTVADAMREGASDFLMKPLDLHRLREVVERIFGDRAEGVPEPDGSEPEAEVQANGAADVVRHLVGRHPRMVEIFKVIGRVAASRAPVVIRGESGTGKELIARAIHATSPAASEPFVAVNCTALPATLLESELFGHVKGAFTGAASDRKGRFAVAGRGTIFLDEIGDTTPEFQAKLLRVLQEGEFHPVGAERPERTEARVVAATHRDLEALVEEERFREDLYYRLRVVEIEIPPLRERMEDLPALAEHLVHKAAATAGRRPPTLSPEAVEVLAAHDWPGNVRELENGLTRAVLLASGGVLRASHLDLRTDGAPAADPYRSLDEVEGAHVSRVLAATGGNRTRSAEILGISRPRLRRLIEKHELE